MKKDLELEVCGLMDIIHIRTFYHCLTHVVDPPNRILLLLFNLGRDYFTDFKP